MNGKLSYKMMSEIESLVSEAYFISLCQIQCVVLFLSCKHSASLSFVAQLIVCCSEYSMQLNASRIKVLQAQDDVISSMKEAASKELLHVSHHHHLTLTHHDHVYRNLLKDLIIQVS